MVLARKDRFLRLAFAAPHPKPSGESKNYMATEDQKSEIAQKFLTGLRNHDWDLLKSIMAPDVVWSLPGRSLISGEAHGVDAVIKRSQLITSYGLNFALKHVLFG